MPDLPASDVELIETAEGQVLVSAPCSADIDWAKRAGWGDIHGGPYYLNGEIGGGAFWRGIPPGKQRPEPIPKQNVQADRSE